MSNDNNSFELASAPVNIPHRLLTLAGAVVLGMVLGAPFMLLILMGGLSGNCDNVPEPCVLWQTLALLSLSPLYIGILGAILAVYESKGFYFTWAHRLSVLIPFGLSLYALAYIFIPAQ